MYNRYIPQPDGSYQKNAIKEPPRDTNSLPHHVSMPSPDPPPPPLNCSSCPNRQPHRSQAPSKSRPPMQNNSIIGFFKQLLPKNFDAEDLLVVILLLLMAGDCKEDKNAALLTLVLYLFL